MGPTGSGTSAPPCASVRSWRSTRSGAFPGQGATKDTPQATGGRRPKTSRSLPGKRRAVTPRNAHGGHHPGWVPPLAHTEAPCDRWPRRGTRAVLTPRGCKAARRNNARRQGTLANPAHPASSSSAASLGGSAANPLSGGPHTTDTRPREPPADPRPAQGTGGQPPLTAPKPPRLGGHVATMGARRERPKGGRRNDRDIQPSGVR